MANLNEKKAFDLKKKEKAKTKENDESTKDEKDEVKDDGDEVKENIINVVDKLTEAVALSLENENFLELNEDLKKTFNSEDLSEEFISEATTLFEAAINKKVSIIKEAIIEKTSEVIQETIETYINDSDTTLSEYLDIVSEEYVSKNELAIKNGITNEISESFMSGLKTLFEDHYIEVPESKVDVLEEFQKEINELKESIQTLTDKNIELKRENSSSKTASIIEEIALNLTDLDTEKLKTLVEGIEFGDKDSFKEKVVLIKEKHFSETNNDIEENLNEEIKHDNEDNDTSVVSQYVKYIGTGTR